MLFCFANLSAEILLHVLGFDFCARHNILAHFCQMLLPLKSIKIIGILCPALVLKMLVKLASA